LKKRLIQYVAQKLSCLQATDGKETAHGDGALPLRQVRLEGLAALKNISLEILAPISWRA